MKEIKAIIRPNMQSEVFAALAALDHDCPGVTVSDTVGWGRTKATGVEDTVDRGRHDFVEKTKLELVVEDDQVEPVVEAIRDHAHTGRPGDGKIFISDVDDVVRVRTGERGTDAI